MSNKVIKICACGVPHEECACEESKKRARKEAEANPKPRGEKITDKSILVVYDGHPTRFPHFEDGRYSKLLLSWIYNSIEAGLVAGSGVHPDTTLVTWEIQDEPYYSRR